MIRKQILIVFLFLISTSTYSQQYKGYKDIVISNLIYDNDRQDIYGISNHLRKLFNQNGFNVLSDMSEATEAIIENKCILLYCYCNHSQGYDWAAKASTGIVEITLKDCEDNILFQDKGSTIAGSSWNVVFQKSVDRALKKFFRNYSYNSKYRPNKVIPLLPPVEKVNENEETVKEYLINNELEELEAIYTSHTSDFITYYKLGIKKKDNKYIAIVLDAESPFWKVGEVKGTFEETSIKGVYNVEWFKMNKQKVRTVAFLEHEKILKIEFNNNNNETIYSTFIKSFPTHKEFKEKEAGKIAKSGSGFVISENGIIATNAHVVNDCDSIIVSFQLDNMSITYNAKSLLVDNNNDVALLKIEDSKFQEFRKVPYSINLNPNIGENIFTIGYPLNSIFGDEIKVTNGIISSTSGIEKDPRFLQITAPIQPGNSGGPLFTENGDLIGITTSSFNDNFLNQDIENVNFAIKISYLVNLYNMLPDKITLNEQNSLTNLELKNQITKVKEFICLIKAF